MLSVRAIDPSPSASIESGYSISTHATSNTSWSSSYLPIGAQPPKAKPDIEQFNTYSPNFTVKVHFRRFKKIVRWLSPRPFVAASQAPNTLPKVQQHLELISDTHCKDKPLPPVPSRLTSYSSIEPRESIDCHHTSYSTLNTPLTSQITIAHIASPPALLESGRRYSYVVSDIRIPNRETEVPTFCTQSDLGHDMRASAIAPPLPVYPTSGCPPSAFTYVDEGVKRRRKLTKRSPSTRTASSSQSTSENLDHSPSQVITGGRPRRRLTKRCPPTPARRPPIEDLIVEPLKLDFTADLPLNTTSDMSCFTTSELHLASSQTHTSAPSVFSDERPSFLRSVSNRRWTLAGTESRPDEDIAAELERLRAINARSQPDLESIRPDEPYIDDPLSDWIANSRTVFICRELLSTERRYLFNLERLYYGETSPPPPQWLARFLPDLINVSRRILTMWESDASTFAMSHAFLSCERELEEALTSWCGIVGELFSGRYHVVLTRSMKERALLDVSQKQDPHIEMSSLTTQGLPMKKTGVERGSRHNTDHAFSKKSRRLNLRDAAIQPSQRVTRYTLLFRDLLHHTSPTSSSHQIVSTALGSAIRLAERCDHSQKHNSFSR